MLQKKKKILKCFRKLKWKQTHSGRPPPRPLLSLRPSKSSAIEFSVFPHFSAGPTSDWSSYSSTKSSIHSATGYFSVLDITASKVSDKLWTLDMGAEQSLSSRITEHDSSLLCEWNVNLGLALPLIPAAVDLIINPNRRSQILRN